MNEYIPEYPHIPEEIDDSVYDEDFAEEIINRPICSYCEKPYVKTQENQIECLLCQRIPSEQKREKGYLIKVEL